MNSEDDVLKNWKWNESKSMTFEFDYSTYPKCNNRMPIQYMVNVLCELPDLSMIHTMYSGHIGHDVDDFLWTWDDISARLISEE